MKHGPHLVEAGRDSERDLMRRHIDGDHDAFAELVQLYRSPVYSYLIRCGIDPADRDDLFQEIFIRIHRSAASFDPERPLHPWIFTIVANAVRTHLRRQRIRSLIRSSDTLDNPPATEEPDAERSTAARQTLGWLEERLHTLPAVRRQVVILVCIENLSLKEAAEVLGLPLGTVKTHLRRARLALASELAARHSTEVSS